MNFASCEVCPTLHEEIKSLKFKLEHDSKDPMIFAMNSKYERTRFRRPYRKTLVCSKINMTIANFMDTTLAVTKITIWSKK